MSGATDILAEMRALDIEVEVKGDSLVINAPEGALNDDRESRIESMKSEIVVELQREQVHLLDYDSEVSESPSQVHTVGISERRKFVSESVSELITTAEDPEFLVERVLPVGGALLIASAPGKGKTFLALDLAIAVALGRPWLDHLGTQKGPVLVIDEENARPLLKDRMQKLMIAEGVEEIPDLRFLAQNCINLSDQSHVALMTELIEQLSPSLIILDSLVRFHRSNENDAMEMARLFAILKRWMNDFRCAFAICHHSRKPGASGNDASHSFRGSSEIQAFADSHLDLSEVKGEDGRKRLEHPKSRWSESMDSFEVEIVDVDGGVRVRYAGESKSRTQKAIEIAIEFLREFLTDSQWHTRQEINEAGTQRRFSHHVLDPARKQLLEVEGDKYEQETRGGKKHIRRKPLSGFPETYIGTETRKLEVGIL